MLSRPPRARGVDINILPERYRAHPLSRLTIALWSAVAVLLIFLLPLWGLYVSVARDIPRLEAEMKVANKALEEVGEPTAEMAALTSTLSQTLHMASQLIQTYETIVAERIDWYNVMDVIINLAPPGIQLSSIAQVQDTTTLQGTGRDEAQVTAYVDALEMSGLFEGVHLQSTSKVPAPPPTPGIAVTPSPQPTLPAPTAVDQYEIDDFSSKPILLGEAQLHSFYPPFDVDLVTFMAKGGHSYRISTSQLALGVDTILDVFVEGTTYTNDDRDIGDLGSSVKFQAPVGYDMPVRIRVRNRGRYGLDKTYLVTLEEIGLADPYEIDDAIPQPISIGETQEHNFYPPGDVDKVKLYVKASRWYTITTSNLAIGVDTHLEVITSEPITYANDDARPGNLASTVSFTTTSAGIVTATITNLDRYGPDKTYRISAWEYGYATPIPSSTATPTATVTSGAIFQPLPGGYGTVSNSLARTGGGISPLSRVGTWQEALSSPARDRHRMMGKAALALRLQQPVSAARLASEAQEMVEFVISLTLKR